VISIPLGLLFPLNIAAAIIAPIINTNPMMSHLFDFFLFFFSMSMKVELSFSIDELSKLVLQF
jgi:hypothetical protein